jgi:AraC-like DNA-binding protein
MKTFKQNQIIIKLNNPDKLFSSFSNQIDYKGKENIYTINNQIAKGQALNIKIEDGLWLTWFDLCFKEETYIERLPSKTSSFYQIVMWFNHDVMKQYKENAWQNVGKYNLIGTMYSSGKLGGKVIVNKNNISTNLSLTFSKKWLSKNFSELSKNNSLILDNLVHKFEQLTPKVELLLKEILLMKIISEINLIKMRGFSLLLVCEIMESLIKQTNLKSSVKLSDKELSYKIKKIIDEEYYNYLTINYISQSLACGELKVQNVFKKNFEITIFKYLQKVRISKSEELLRTSKYNVNEVGAAVGYSNISHFIKAFKNYNNITPNEYLKKYASS